MRAKFINEDSNFYSDIGLSGRETMQLKSTKDPFEKLSRDIQEFKGGDVLIKDLKLSFEWAKNEIIEDAIINYIYKELGIEFTRVKTVDENNWERDEIQAKLPDGGVVNLMEHQGGWYVVKDPYFDNGESKGGKKLKNITKNIKNYLDGLN